MTNSTQRPHGIRHRLNVGVGLALFLTLSGAGVAQANWTAEQKATTGTASSGALSLTQSGFAAHSYDSSNLSVTYPVTITNTSAVTTQAFSIAIAAADRPSAPIGSLGTTAPIVKVWLKGDCSAVPNSAVTIQGGTVASYGVPLAADASATVCVQSSISLPQRYSLVGGVTDLTSITRVELHNWYTSATAEARQRVRGGITPGTPTLGTPAPTTRAITINWTAPVDAAGLAGYKVYREKDGVTTLVGTTANATTLTMTDSELLAGTAYAYTVRGFVRGTPAEPANAALFTESPVSGVLQAATIAAPGSPPSGVVSIQGADGKCFEGKDLTFTTCGSVDDQWRLVPTVVGGVTYYYIENQNNFPRRLTVQGFNVGMSNGDADLQKWTVIPAGTQFRFASASRTGQCLAASGDANMVLASCDATSSAQKFTVN